MFLDGVYMLSYPVKDLNMYYMHNISDGFATVDAVYYILIFLYTWLSVKFDKVNAKLMPEKFLIV